LPDEAFNFDILDHLYGDDVVQLEIINKYSKLKINRTGMLNHLLYSLDEDTSIGIESPFGKYVSIIIMNMDESEIVPLLSEAISEGYDYIDFILECSDISDDATNDAIIDILSNSDIVDYKYGGDLSLIVASLNKHTNLSDLKLLRLAVNNNIALLITEILKYVTVDDTELLSMIEDII
jgi:hypothetical protein